jgi:hypothetical protein
MFAINDSIFSRNCHFLLHFLANQFEKSSPRFQVAFYKVAKEAPKSMGGSLLDTLYSVTKSSTASTLNTPREQVCAD